MNSSLSVMKKEAFTFVKRSKMFTNLQNLPKFEFNGSTKRTKRKNPNKAAESLPSIIWITLILSVY